MKFKNLVERKEWINKSIQSGMTYQDVAKILGISRQRVHQIYSYRLVKLDRKKINMVQEVKVDKST